MKKILIRKNSGALVFFLCMLCVSCNDLDLEQEDATSTSGWFQNEDQFRTAINELYRPTYWYIDAEATTDNFTNRNLINAVKEGSVNSSFTRSRSFWNDAYRGLARAVAIIERLDDQGAVVLDPEVRSRFRGEVDFVRATILGNLVAHFGDIPFYEKTLTATEYIEISRTDKDEVLEKVYGYYDSAIANLPVSYTGTGADGIQFATKGAALAYKARTALWAGDYDIAAEAAKECMDLGVYSLHPNYEELFFQNTRISSEFIFQLPRSAENTVAVEGGNVRRFITTNAGGTTGQQRFAPSWRLLASYECIDGLPIDESPLFDPSNPFKDRDPRCKMTIVPFGKLSEDDDRDERSPSVHLDVEYTPHPDVTTVMDFRESAEGSSISNKDNIIVSSAAPNNGLAWKKGITVDYLVTFDGLQGFQHDSNIKLMRFAEVLLTYAEAKIELDEIDNTVLDAINEVKRRAYAGTGIATPEITTTNQEELRLKLRTERRVEFPLEGIRYMDLIRWRHAEIALSGGVYGLLLRPDLPGLVDDGNWFWGIVPEIDENGLPDLSALLENNLCISFYEQNFNPELHYLWPIPDNDRVIAPNLSQNPGY